MWVLLPLQWSLGWLLPEIVIGEELAKIVVELASVVVLEVELKVERVWNLDLWSGHLGYGFRLWYGFGLWYGHGLWYGLLLWHGAGLSSSRVRSVFRLVVVSLVVA